MASYSGGVVTVAEVDAHVLQLPAGERPAPGADLDAWYADLLRTMVVDRRLLEEARQAGLQHGEEFRLRRIAIERQLSVQSCLSELRPGLNQVSSEELQAAFAEREDQFRAPERRATFHIYRRLGSEDSLEEIEAWMLSIRERILRGESFQRVAQSESDSETRHRQGSIGWVVRGQLPAAFEELVFDLEEGVPSHPVVTSDGVHLFQVDDILPERQLSAQEVASTLRAQLEAEKFAEALEDIAAMNPSPAATVIDRERLEHLVQQGAEAEVVLATNAYQLSLKEFKQRLGRVLGDGKVAENRESGGMSNEVAWSFLNRLFRHEAAYEYCSDNGLVADEAVARQMNDWEERTLVARIRQQRLSERAMADVDRLELYYQSNIGQFTPPVQWDLKRLRVPFESPAQGKALMARLESLSAKGSGELETLQRDLGGELEAVGWITLQQMRRINPKLPPRVTALEDGALVAPLRVDEGLELYQVMARKQFEPRPFEQVSDEVASAFLRQYTSEVYDRLEADILDAIQFELYTDRLDTLRDSGLPSTEITVEELDALLSGS